MYREDERLELRESIEDDTDGVEPNFDDDIDMTKVTENDFIGMSLEDENGDSIEESEDIQDDLENEIFEDSEE